MAPKTGLERPRRELTRNSLIRTEPRAVVSPEWGGKKVRVPLEDDAVVTDRGVEWPYPVNDHILLIR